VAQAKSGKVVPLDPPARIAERRVRALAQESRNVYLSKHARHRMQERSVSFPQVIGCLKAGTIDEPFHIEAGCWTARFCWRTCGDLIRVVAKLEDRGDEKVVVITVIA